MCVLAVSLELTGYVFSLVCDYSYNIGNPCNEYEQVFIVDRELYEGC
jgi:hypothetical protein